MDMYIVGTTTLQRNFFLRSILHFPSYQRSLAPSISISGHCASKMAPFRATSMATHSASHAYQFCQPTNDGPDKPAEIRIKGGHSEQQASVGRSKLSDTHQEETAIRYIKKEKTTLDCPATMPRGPGHTTAKQSRQQQLSARHSRLPHASPPTVTVD